MFYQSMSTGDLSTCCGLPQSLSSEVCSSPCRSHSHPLLSLLPGIWFFFFWGYCKWNCFHIFFLSLFVGVRRQLCELLSALFQTAAHLPPTASYLLLQALFTETSSGEQLVAPPAFSGGGACLLATFAVSVYWMFTWRAAPCFSPLLRCTQSTLPPCCVSFSVPCLLFSFRFFVFVFVFFCEAGVSLSRGLCWFVPGVAVGVPCAAYLLTCWSESPKQIWSRHLLAQEPSWFLSVTWCGEALCGLWAQGVGVLLLLDGVFPPSRGSAPQQDFWFTEVMLSTSSL
jgi:hypothetical protein